MKPFARMLGRIAIIAIAAALFAGLTSIYARIMRPRIYRNPPPGDRRDQRARGAPRDRRGRGELADPRRRSDTPQLSRIPEVFQEVVLFALVTFAGRKILRLRL